MVFLHQSPSHRNHGPPISLSPTETQPHALHLNPSKAQTHRFPRLYLKYPGMGLVPCCHHHGRLELGLVVRLFHGSLDTLRHIFATLHHPTILLLFHISQSSYISSSFPPFSSSHAPFCRHGGHNGCLRHPHLLYSSTLPICS